MSVRTDETIELINAHKAIFEALSKEDAILSVFPRQSLSRSKDLTVYFRLLRKEKDFLNGLQSIIREDEHAHDESMLTEFPCLEDTLKAKYNSDIESVIDWYNARYHLDGAGIFRTESAHNNVFRIDVIRKCIRMCEFAFSHYPAPKFISTKKRYSSFSYSLKHRLEHWFQVLDKDNPVHGGYVSNGEACAVILYFNAHAPYIMKAAKNNWLDCPNINITIPELLHHFFEGLPSRLG